MNKKKILNDPVYGFITIKTDLIFKIIEHPFFQRLRRIKQLGLTDLVYPGAIHTRFHHALGAMHLMSVALDNLRNKQVKITDEEFEAAQIAILLHDIGHGPFSHTLENALLNNISHEDISLEIMKNLNEEFDGLLECAIEIFKGEYPRKFLNQLVSSQLDVDRLDYLKRDSFYTGVYEGTIGITRIMNMLNVKNDELVVEEKGIYSIENFLVARRLMYWQVYLHKTTVAAEKMLMNLISRAKKLAHSGKLGHLTNDSLNYFLLKDIDKKDLVNNEKLISNFTDIDDNDIWWAIKIWRQENDKILSELSNGLLSRNLFKIKLSNTPISENDLKRLTTLITRKYNLQNENEAEFLFSSGSLYNSAYIPHRQEIRIMDKHGDVKGIKEMSDLPNISSLSKIVKKYYLCCPKNVSL